MHPFDTHPNEPQRPHSKLLERAKQITSVNRSKLEAAKKWKMEETPSFLTGVGLYTTEFEEEPLDGNALLKQLVSHDHDDLAELRKMIKTTQGNLRQYSKSVRNIQKEVLSAADRYNQELDVGLRTKMNHCELEGQKKRPLNRK